MDKRKLFVRVAIVDELTLPEEETLNEKQPHGIKLDIWSQPFSIDLNKPKSAPYTTSWVSARQADGSLNTLKLFLSLRTEPKGYGSDVGVLYCPYQVVNNTDLGLSMRPRTTSGEPYIPSRPQPKSEFDKRRVLEGKSDVHMVWLYSPLTRTEETVISFDGFRSKPFDVSKLVAGNSLIKCFSVDEKGDLREQDRAPKILMIHWEFGDEDLLSRRLYIDPILTFKNETTETIHICRVKNADDQPISQRTHSLQPNLTWHNADIPDKSLWKVGIGSASGAGACV